jgi:RND family efflux transporter MFP subunit
MSVSMWTWRVVVPGLGLAVSAVILWQSWQLGHARTVGSQEWRRQSGESHSRFALDRVVADGRVVARPAADIVLSAEDAGTIAEVAVREKSRVRKGDVLVILRAADQEAAVAEASAKLAAAEADLAYQQREFKRRVGGDASSKEYPGEVDAVRRDLQMATAHRQAAAAFLKRCEAALARTRLTSPIDGTVLGRFVHPGETVTTGTRLIEVADLSRVYVEAEVDEFDVGRITQGEPVSISAEGQGTHLERGRVEDIPDRVVERDVRPEDPGRPSDSRVLLVKIALEQPVRLKLGQRVEVEISRSRRR